MKISLYILLLFLFTNSLFANELNATLTLSQPDGNYFDPGDSVIATLTLTDADGEALRIDNPRGTRIVTVELWVSGPRQDYNLIDPYEAYAILDQRGFHDDVGFDAETGEIAIAIPDDLEMTGSYTVLFKVLRRWNGEIHSQFPAVDFLVGQPDPTRTESFRYLTCNGQGCHDDGFRDHGTHASIDLNECIICHTHDHDLPWDGFIHTLRCHEEDGEEYFDATATCHLCHLANAGIDHYTNTACFSCHDIDDAPLHDGYSEAECEACHEEEEQDVYETHEEFRPTSPEDFFLIKPDDRTIISQFPVRLWWSPSRDIDPDDFLIYELELATDPDFENVTTFELGDTTYFELSDLDVDTDYWWRVKAVDLNTDGTYSTRTRRFRNIVNRADSPVNSLPTEFSISTPYPNPFNSTVNIGLYLSEPNDISVSVHDLTGREVYRIDSGRYEAGFHPFSWNAKGMPNGIYLIRSEANGEFVAMRKVILLK